MNFEILFLPIFAFVVVYVVGGFLTAMIDALWP